MFERIKNLLKREVRAKEPIEDASYVAATTGYDSHRAAGLPTAGVAHVAMARQWVGICSKFFANNCAQVPLRLYTRAGSGMQTRRIGTKRADHLRNPVAVGKASVYAENAGDVEEVMDHPVLTLLQSPNATETGVEFMRRAYQALAVMGNAYPILTEDAVSISLSHLMPQWVRVIPGRERIIDGYYYGKVNAIEERFDPEQVCHVRLFPALDNPYYGVGYLSDIVAESNVFAQAIAYELKSMENGLRPSEIAIKAGKDTTPDQVKAMRDELRQHYSSASNAGKVMIYVDSEPFMLSRTNRDMEYQEGMERIRKMTFAAFGIPDALLLRAEGAVQLGGDGASGSAYKTYCATTLTPALRSVCETFNAKLLPMLGYEPGSVWLAYDDAAPESQEERIGRVQSLVSTGIITVDEARAELGMDPMPESDKPDDQAETDPKDAKTARKSAPKGQVIPSSKYDAKVRKAFERFYRGIRPTVLEMIGEQGMSAMLATDPDVLDALNTAARSLEAPLFGGYVEGAAALRAFGLASPKPYALTVNAVALLERHVGKLVRTLAESIDADVRQALADGLAAGETLAQRIRRVDIALRGTAVSSPATLAATESARMQNLGALQAWKENGNVESVEWLLSGDPCPFCKSLHRKTVPIGQAFLKAGDTLRVSGHSLTATYGDVMGPPLHPNCMCGLAPVIGKLP